MVRARTRSSTGVIAIFCAELQRGGLPTYGDGHQSRDFVYVADVVEAFLAADAALVERPEPSGPYNVGTGRETTVLELVERMRTICDSPGFVPALAAGTTGRDPANCARLLESRGRARMERPDVTDDGLERTASALGIAPFAGSGLALSHPDQTRNQHVALSGAVFRVAW